MYYLELIDDTVTKRFNLLEVPLTESEIEAAVENETIDYNVYLDIIANNKRVWNHTWKYMDATEFDQLKGFYDRQLANKKFPLLNVGGRGINNIVVRMQITPRSIIDNCGVVEKVTITLRETIQRTMEI